MTDKTQPRDWSGVVDKLLNLASIWKYSKAMMMDFQFKAEALTILQEFDAQNQANLSDKAVCGVERRDKASDLDELIKVVIKTINWSGSWTGLYLYIKKNYPQQCEKYMARETKNPNVSESMSDEIDEIINAPTEAPFEWVIGEAYEDRQRLIYVYVGKNPVKTDKNPLLFVNRESSQPVARFNDGTSELSSEYDIIRKHTPAPAEHTVEFWVNVYKISKGKIVTEYGLDY